MSSAGNPFVIVGTGRSSPSMKRDGTRYSALKRGSGRRAGAGVPGTLRGGTCAVRRLMTTAAPPAAASPGTDAARVLADQAGPDAWHRWFLVLAVPLGLTMAFLLPPAVSPDADRHLLRTDQIANGELIPAIDAEEQAYWQPDACTGAAIVRIGWLVLAEGSRPAEAFEPVPCRPQAPRLINNVASNSPVAYVPAVAGFELGRIADARTALWGARLGWLAAYVAMAWWAIRLAPVGKPFLFLVALLPTALSSAATWSADAVPTGLGLLVAALVLRLRTEHPAGRSDVERRDPTSRLLMGLAACIALLALAKNLYAPVSLVVLLVPADRFGSPRHRRLYVSAVVGTVLALSAAWWLAVVNRIRFIGAGGYIDSGVAKGWILSHPWSFLRIVFRSLFGTRILLDHTAPGTVAWFRVGGENPTPPLLVQLPVLGLAVLAIASDRARGAAATARSTFERFAPAVVVPTIFVAVTALVCFGEAIAYAPPLALDPNIEFIEGRFYLPVLPLVLLAVPLRRSSSDRATGGRLLWLLPASALALNAWYLLRIDQLYF